MMKNVMKSTTLEIYRIPIARNTYQGNSATITSMTVSMEIYLSLVLDHPTYRTLFLKGKILQHQKSVCIQCATSSRLDESSTRAATTILTN